MNYEQFGPMPEGAEKRFSEYVIEEVNAGRFQRDRFYGIFDRREYESPDAGQYRFDVPPSHPYSAANYDKNVFSFEARVSFFRKKPIVSLSRGRNDISNLLSIEEKWALVYAYEKAEAMYKTRQTQKQREAEAKRQRAAWWP